MNREILSASIPGYALFLCPKTGTKTEIKQGNYIRN